MVEIYRKNNGVGGITLKKQELAFMAIRILSLYILVKAFLSLAQLTHIQVINYMSMVEQFKELAEGMLFPILLVAIGPFVLLLTFSILLWIYAKSISQYMILDKESAKIEEDTDTLPSLTSDDLQTIAFSVIGLILVSITIPDLFNIIPNLLNLNELGDLATDNVKMSTFMSLLAKIVQLLIGFGLFFGGKGISSLLKRVRGV